MSDDFAAIALARSQADFAAAFPYPFLVGAPLSRPITGPTPTLRGDDVATLTALRDKAAAERASRPTPPGGTPPRTVLAVRKLQSSFPSMITIGRTRNNDVVIADPMVSKFHAYFRIHEGMWLLADAGSANGTKVNDTELPRKGAPSTVRFGDRVSFGDSLLTFMDAASAWTSIRARR